MADDDTDLAALRAEVERVAQKAAFLGACAAGCEGRCSQCPDDIGRDAAALLRRLLDRLARAEAERDTLLLWRQIAVDRGQHLGAALEQRDAAEARAQAAEAVCEAVWAYEYGDADMLDLSKLHEWRAARETQA